jgi:hypothetical protein
MGSSSSSPDTGDNLRRRSYPESHLQVLRAFERRWEESGRVPFESAAVAGKNPFSRGKIWSYLNDLEAEAKYLKDIKAPDLLVLGRSWVDDSEKRLTKRLLKRRQGERLRICSQEMLLAWAMTGIDPNKRPETADTFVEGHPALEFVLEELGDRWPGTDPIPTSGGNGDFEGPTKSPLKRLGYEVGQSGASKSKRRSLLRKTYRKPLDDLPGNYPQEYIQKWGPGESGKRLQRIANHLAANCRNFRKRDGNYGLAIDHWEEDLEWLKQKYYYPLTYGFEWPNTKE